MRLFSVAALCAVASIGLIGSAAAADLSVKPRAVIAPPIPVYSLTGFYVGVNGGYHVGVYDTSMTNTDPDPGSESGTTSPQGGVFGGQIGYNYQFAPMWVVGLEGDMQWTGGKDTGLCLGECGTPGVAGDDQLVIDTQLQWLATLRGRVGWLHNDYLWYFTGGAAWGNVKVTATGYDLDTTSAPVGTISTTDTKGGFVVGGGVETHLWANWTAKLEYLYVDLGSVTASGLVAINGNPNQTSTATADVREHIIRAGVNWNFCAGQC